MKIASLTLLALLAFAGNSVLCRLALGGGLIDAAGFTSVRLLAGTLTLIFVLLFTGKRSNKTTSLKPTRRQFFGSTMLFIYAWCLSVAYLILDTGSGALILFGFVQLTMLFSSWWQNQRPKPLELFGMLLAFLGLVYWLVPAWGTPSLGGFLMMALAGIAWGLYTLAGQTTQRPLVETTRNFICCLPLVLLLNLWVFQPQYWSLQGIILAVISGSVTSGVGYAIWYSVLPRLSAMNAGVLQLLVPLLAALGGWIVSSESISQRWLLSALLVLAGVYLSVTKQLNSNENQVFKGKA